LAYNLSARFGVRETAYSYALNADSAPGAMNRVLGEFGASWAGPRLERSFGALRHVIEPTIEYHLVTGADRFRDTVVVDDVDLYADTSDVTYGVVNHLLGRNREVIWRVFQKVFFERDFGGALVPGRRNAFAPLMDLTGFSFSDRARRFSPVVSSLSMAGFRHVSADFVAQLDTELHEFRNAGVVTNLTFGLVAAGVSYYYSRGTIFELASHQAGGGVRYGGNNKPGISISSSFAYDVQRALFQGAAAQVGYNGGCYGVSVLFETFDIGVRKESRIRFAFALKNVGAYGTLTPAERLY
jgi:LPS-assembly protein